MEQTTRTHTRLRRLLSLLLTAALLLCAAPLTGTSVFDFAKTAFAADDYIYDYELDDEGNATITSYSGVVSSFSIPGSIDGHTVTKIGGNAFAGNVLLSNIIIPDTVTEIHMGAFSDCPSLSQVTLSKNLVSLESGAFSNCDALMSINIPKSLEECPYSSNWGNGPFADCSNLKTVTFEKGVTKIPAYLFAKCDGLETITIPDTITEIGWDAFLECTGLTSVVLSEYLTTVGVSAFSGCQNLSQVTLPENLVSLGSGAFSNCDALTSINIPKSLEDCPYSTNWNNGPFVDCSNLKTVTFEKGVTKIPAYLFAKCDGLETITIPDTITEIGWYAFLECTGLTSVTLSENTLTIDNWAFCNCNNLSQIVLPDSLASLGRGVFENCDALTTINIPRSLEQVLQGYSGEISGPFSFCTNLKTVVFEEGITTIIDYLFQNCDGLEEIAIPNTVTKIGVQAFSNCTVLKNVLLPQSLENLSASSFNNCQSLDEIAVPNSVTEMGNFVFNDCSALTDVTLPNQLESLPESAFGNCQSLQTIQLPGSIKEIGRCAFLGCAALESISIPNGVTVIKDSTFYQCTSLMSISLPDGLQTVERGAFNQCSALEEIVLPDVVTYIGDSAFMGCESMTKAVIPASVKSIGDNLFNGDESLVDVQIADYSITVLPDNTFKDCSSLETVVLPKGLERIGEQAFMNDVALRNVTIPASVTEIASNAISYPKKTTIYGVAGSYAETYASQKGMTFVDIGVPATAVALADGTDTVTVKQGETVRIDLAFTPADATDVVTLSSDAPWYVVEIHGMDITGNDIGDFQITATTTGGLTYTFTLHVNDGHEHSFGAWTFFDENQHYRVCAENEEHVEYADHAWNGRVCEVCGYVRAIPPEVPQNVTVSATAEKTITVTWSAVDDATQYNVYRYNGTAYKYIGTTYASAANPTRYADGGLTVGTDYYYKVVAVYKGNGLTLQSDKSAFAHTVALGKPAVPANVAVKPTGEKKLTVSWSAVKGATQYNVYRYRGSDKQYHYLGTTLATAANPTQYADTGLTVGTAYYYKVVAVCKGNGLTFVGDLSSSVNAKVLGKPAVPANVAVNPTGEKKLTVSWASVKGATQYNVYRYNGTEYKYVGTTFADAAKPTQYADGGLTVGTDYYYKVVAVVKGSGLTFVSDKSAFAHTVALGKPAVPANVAVKPTGEKELTVSWNAVKGATQYNVYRYRGSDKQYHYLGTTLAAASNPTQYADTGLSVGTAYYYKVVAVVKGSGLTFVGDLSSSVNAVALGTPAVPANVKATASGARTITVSWSAVKGATQYNVYRYNGTTYKYIGTTSASASKPTQYADSGLTVGTDYYYKVVAVVKGSGLTFQSEKSAFAHVVAKA